MIIQKKTNDIYNELSPLLKTIPAVTLFYFAQDYMVEIERDKKRIFKDESVKTAFQPTLPVQALGQVFNVARQDMGSFMFSAAPANVEQLLCADKRETLIKTMLEMGLESRIRAFVSAEIKGAQQLAL